MAAATADVGKFSAFDTAGRPPNRSSEPSIREYDMLAWRGLVRNFFHLSQGSGIARRDLSGHCLTFVRILVEAALSIAY